MLKFLFIDFDGVLMDTETEVYKATREWFLEKTGHIVTLEEYALAAGSWHVQFINHLKTNRGLAFSPEEFKTFYEGLEASRLCHLPLMAGVPQLLEDAHRLGIQCAIVSSNLRPTIESRVDILNIRHHFSFILTMEEVSRPKPAPDLFLEALLRSGTTPDEALVIEDSLNGIRSATAAGLRTLAVPSTVTRNYPFNEAWKKVYALDEISLKDLQTAFNRDILLEQK